MLNAKLKFEKRQKRVRYKISKVSNRLRLSVFKSGRHIYAQIIDDINSKTLASASTLGKKNKKSHCNIEHATKVGKLIAEKALAIGIKEVVFDKGGYKYHGVIKAVAEAAREKTDLSEEKLKF